MNEQTLVAQIALQNQRLALARIGNYVKELAKQKTPLNEEQKAELASRFNAIIVGGNPLTGYVIMRDPFEDYDKDKTHVGVDGM
jgi:hypothetical protein